jgi:hypothetical protein
MSVIIKVALKIMTTILTKMNKKKYDVFGYGPIDMKIKVMNEMILILQCKIIVLLSMCYP